MGRKARFQLRIFSDPEQLARGAAQEFVRRTTAGQAAERPFAVVLSGGSTPKRMFELLAGEPYRDQVLWERIHFFWGDERSVPPDHPDSNFAAANQALLSRLELSADNLHRIQAELDDPGLAAARYEDELRRFFGLAEEEMPRFDLVFLGMGADGHTASLFPGTQALDEERRLAVATWVAKLGAHRVSLTCPVFNNAACILFLVSGAEKAETLRQVLESGREPLRYPAQLIRPQNGELLWYVDEAAAQRLQPSANKD
ncbi:MAG: 6-phosphogluconolactonase [Gemmatimonas sp. SM23_52]|nr:MAG: 6-phosphogluconolactonase [Gemmatimonas sp. SM23_52]